MVVNKLRTLIEFMEPMERLLSAMIIVPSSALETMNLGAIGGMAAMSQMTSEEEQSN